MEAIYTLTEQQVWAIAGAAFMMLFDLGYKADANLREREDPGEGGVMDEEELNGMGKGDYSDGPIEGVGR